MQLSGVYHPLWKLLTKLIIFIVIIKSVFDLLSTILVQTTTAIFGDTLTYFALGRALLNGLTLYRDIYDTKPPGIFLLSAASLASTDNELPANLAQAAAFLLIPLSVALLGWTALRSAMPQTRRIALLLSALFGLCLMQYTALRTGGSIQTEPFGAAACISYFVLLASTDGHFRLRHFLLASLCMTVAVGMKEPFIVILFAGALALCPSPRSFLRTFLLTALLTAAIGILALTALGALRAYVTFSLPELFFGNYIFAHIPFWIGAFNFMPVFLDFWQFSPALLCLAILFVLGALSQADPEHRLGIIAPSIGLLLLPAIPFCCLILWAHFTGLPFSLRSVFRLPVLQGTWTCPLLWFLIFLTGLIAAANILMIRRLSKAHWKTILFTVIRIGTVILLTFMVVGLRGKYYPHYFVFAVPVLAVFFLLSLRAVLRFQQHAQRIFMGTAILLASVTLLGIPSRSPLPLTIDYDRQRQDFRSAATRFDALLDACGQDRYLAYGEETQDLWAYTEHTPYGSSFSHMTWVADRTSPKFRELYEQRLQQTRIIVLDPWRIMELESERNGTLWSSFSRKPPPCAEHFLPIDHYLLLFRKTPDPA